MKHLDRFLLAQQTCWETVLSELANAQKATCWMWWIFPQLERPGTSSTSQYYGLMDVMEAEDYLAHNILGPRLLMATDLVLLAPRGRTLEEIFGKLDAMKFRSCMRLFASISKPGSVFHQALKRWPDETRFTHELLPHWFSALLRKWFP